MGLQATGSLATTVIITKGLPCGDLPVDEAICSFGVGITPWFSLYCRTVPPSPPKPKQGGMGGSRVLLPGEIQNLYKVLPPEQQYYVVPRDKEASYFARYQNVMVKVKFGNKEVEKVFRVREDRIQAITTIQMVLNVTRDRMSIAVDKIKHITSESFVRVKNIVLRQPKR